MFCTSCGSKLQEGAAFCTSCGARQEAAPAPEAPTQVLPLVEADRQEPVSAPVPPVPVAPAEPAAQATAVWPQVTPPAAEEVQYAPAYDRSAASGFPPHAQPEAASSHTGRTTLVVVSAAIAILLIAGGVGAWAVTTGKISLPGANRGAAESAKKDDTKKDDAKTDASKTSDATDQTSGSTGDAPNAVANESGSVSAEDSYQALVDGYDTLTDLRAQVGIPRTDGKWGGTGFAYDTFSRNISAADRSVRQDTLDQCRNLLDDVSSAAEEFSAVEVDSQYADQKARIENAYSLLEKQMEIMTAAMEIAVDDPTESAWRPTLTPASSNNRKALEAAYAAAKPTEL